MATILLTRGVEINTNDLGTMRGLNKIVLDLSGLAAIVAANPTATYVIDGNRYRYDRMDSSAYVFRPAKRLKLGRWPR